MASFFPVQNQPTTLFGSGVVAGSTTIQLTNFNQINGTPLTMANFGTIGFFTLEPGNGTLEESGTFSGITPNADGTVTLTGVATQLTVSPYTQTPGLAQSHAGGVYFVLSNTAGFYNEFPNLPDNATIAGVYAFLQPPQVPTDISSNIHSAASIEYVNNATTSGAPNAATNVKGIVQLATATQMAVGVVIGSTGAALVPPNSLFSATATVAQVGVVTGTNGIIGTGFILGGVAGGFATLNSANLVIQNPANATLATVAGVIPITDVNATLNTFVPGPMQNFVAGEVINASSVPKVVMLSPIDGKVYNLNASAATATAFYVCGFVNTPQNVTASAFVVVQTEGTVHNFSGLSAGKYYYSSNTPGNIGTTAGTESLLVGQADTTGNNLFIIQGKKVTSGVTSFSATATQAIVCGFQPTKVVFYATAGGSGQFGISNGAWDVNGGNNCSALQVTSSAASSGFTQVGNSWSTNSATSGGNNHSGSLSVVGSTGFTLSNLKTGTPNANVEIFWQAEA